jgi:cold shock protein
MPTGKVKWFNEHKGFGFIQSDDGGPDLFVHHGDIQTDGFRTLSEGQAVEYQLERGPKGLKATAVKPLTKAQGN